MRDPFQYDTDPRQTPLRLEPGLRLFRDRYELVRELGAGGMGVVWLAKNHELKGIDRALKFLPCVRAWDHDDLDRLKSEVLAADALTHPRLIATKGFEHDPPYAAIVMEYVEGFTLKQKLAREANRCFEPPQIRHWVLQLVEALMFLHKDAERIHRDIKPANVMVDVSGKAKLMDFGISEQIRHTISSHSRSADLPATKSSSHTLAYASPQQVRGDPATEWDDIYGLGALIYELLTGRPPFFRGDTTLIALQIERQTPPPMARRRLELMNEGVIMCRQPVLDERWECLTAACLSKLPKNRPTLEEIHDVLRGGPLPEIMRRFVPPQSQPRLRWGLFSAVVLTVVMVGVITFTNLPQDLRSGLVETDQLNTLPVQKAPTEVQPVAIPATEAPAELGPVAITRDDIAEFVRHYYEMCNVPGGHAGRAAMLAEKVKFFEGSELQDRATILAKDKDYQTSWPQQYWKVGKVNVQQKQHQLWLATAPFDFKLEDPYFEVTGQHVGTLELEESPTGLLISSINAKESGQGNRRLKQEGFRQFVAAYLSSCKVDERELEPKTRPWEFFSDVVTSYFNRVSPKTGRKELSRDNIQAFETEAAEASIRRDFSLADDAAFNVAEIKPQSGGRLDVLYEVQYSVRFKILYKGNKPPSESPARPEYCRISFKSGKPLITEIGKP